MNTAYFHTKAIEEKGSESLKVVFTKEITDRDGEILAVKGAKLKNFKQNPVMAWGHKAITGEHDDIVGKWENIRVEKDKDGKAMITGTPKFARHTKARELEEMIKDGIISTVSVGFFSEDFDPDTRTHKEWELFETSWVAIPANVEAKVIAKNMKEDLGREEIIKQLKHYHDIYPKIKEVRDLFLGEKLIKQLNYEKTGDELVDYKNVYDLLLKHLSEVQETPSSAVAQNVETPQYATVKDVKEIFQQAWREING